MGLPTLTIRATGLSGPRDDSWNSDICTPPNMSWPWSLYPQTTANGASRRTTCLASSATAPAVPQILSDFSLDSLQLGTSVVTIEVVFWLHSYCRKIDLSSQLMGSALGLLILAPISEMRGHRILYNIANLRFCAFLAGML
jgi:hypothetical protein